HDRPWAPGRGWARRRELAGTPVVDGGRGWRPTRRDGAARGPAGRRGPHRAAPPRRACGPPRRTGRAALAIFEPAEPFGALVAAEARRRGERLADLDAGDIDAIVHAARAYPL